MNIGWAVEAMNEGMRVCRPGWNGKNMWVAIQEPGKKSKMTEPLRLHAHSAGRENSVAVLAGGLACRRLGTGALTCPA